MMDLLSPNTSMESRGQPQTELAQTTPSPPADHYRGPQTPPQAHSGLHTEDFLGVCQKLLVLDGGGLQHDGWRMGLRRDQDA